MNRIDNILNISVLTLVLVVSLAAGASAQTTQTQWLWPDQSVAVAQSTASLVTGHPGRAAIMAERGLNHAQGHDRVVASHNLCLALLNQSWPERATPACDDAVNSARMITRRVGEQSIFEIVTSNIARARNKTTDQPTTVAQTAR